jgi:hypothetical protein
MKNRPLRILALIVVVSVAARLGAALILGGGVETLPGISDQVSYHMLAQQVVSGHGFTVAADWWPLTRAGEATAHWSYLYTLYLALFYAVFGVQPLLPRLVQAVIVGAVWPILAYRIGRRVAGERAGERVGLIAAAWSAAYGYFAYYAAALMTEPFFITAILWSVDLMLDLAARRPQFRRYALLGLAIGTAVLLRQLFLVVVPVLLAWLWAARNIAAFGVSGSTSASTSTSTSGSTSTSTSTSIGARLARAALSLAYPICSLAVVGLMILPWTIRNAQAFGQFVMLNTNAGFAFYWANHPAQGTQFAGLLASDQAYLDLVPAELRGLNEAALDSALLRLGLAFVTDDPGRYALLSLSRVPAFFMFWPSSDSGLISNVVRVLSFGVALPFMLYGLIAALPAWRRWLPLYLFAAVYTVIHLLSWALVRYRLPVDALLLIFAAYAVSDLHGRLARRAARGQAA